MKKLGCGIFSLYPLVFILFSCFVSYADEIDDMLSEALLAGTKLNLAQRMELDELNKNITLRLQEADEYEEIARQSQQQSRKKLRAYGQRWRNNSYQKSRKRQYNNQLIYNAYIISEAFEKRASFWQNLGYAQDGDTKITLFKKAIKDYSYAIEHLPMQDRGTDKYYKNQDRLLHKRSMMFFNIGSHDLAVRDFKQIRQKDIPPIQERGVLDNRTDGRGGNCQKGFSS